MDIRKWVRNFLLFAIIAAPVAVFAADRAVRIITAFAPEGRPDHHRFVTGDTVPENLLITILFTNESCSLKIDGSNRMLRAWQAQGAYQVGCWFPMADDTFYVMDGLGHGYHNPMFWEMFPRALLHSDGSATIVEKNYDSESFAPKVMQEKAMRAFSRLHEKP